MNNITVAIGDIHGCLIQLKNMVDFLRNEHGSFTLVALGDYIDRGPDSAEVIDYLITLNDDKNIKLICLKGNHEEMMMDCFLNGDSSMLNAWLRNGGEQTIDSYMRYAADITKNGLPEKHIHFLASLEEHYDDGKRLFVHAGVDPAILTIEEQPSAVKLWIRGRFLTSRHQLDRIVVHGHTICADGPVQYDWRINLDSGVYRTGMLSAAAFDDDNNSIRFYSANHYEVKHVDPLKIDVASNSSLNH